MINILKAEFKKLLTVRSTYFITLIAFALSAFVSFYGEGFRQYDPNLPGINTFLGNSMLQHAGIVGVFAALVAILLITHEYRHNTIIYTLTAANNRSKVIASKIITIFTYTLVFALFMIFSGLLLTKLGIAASGKVLVPQNISYISNIIKDIFVCEGWALFGLMIGALIRNQVGAIAIVFIYPNTIETLLGLILKHNTVYLPFMGLSQVTQTSATSAREAAMAQFGQLSPLKGSLVFAAYLIIFWIITWILFLRRDAS